MTTTLDSPPPPDTVIQPTQTRVAVKRPGRFRAAWRSEWIKLATVRSPKAIAGLTIVVGGLASFMVARFVTDEEITVANVFGFSAVFTAVFAAVSGILIYTAETEHHEASEARGLRCADDDLAARRSLRLENVRDLFARELGAVIGLSVGYITKYQLDRRFVFKDLAP